MFLTGNYNFMKNKQVQQGRESGGLGGGRRHKLQAQGPWWSKQQEEPGQRSWLEKIGRYP